MNLEFGLQISKLLQKLVCSKYLKTSELIIEFVILQEQEK